MSEDIIETLLRLDHRTDCQLVDICIKHARHSRRLRFWNLAMLFFSNIPALILDGLQANYHGIIRTWLLWSSVSAFVWWLWGRNLKRNQVDKLKYAQWKLASKARLQAHLERKEKGFE